MLLIQSTASEIMAMMQRMQSSGPGKEEMAKSAELAKQQEFDNLEDALVHIMSNSCTQFCQSGGYGDGTVIGTAPFCDGVCGRDCATHCTIANSDWEDYGAGCWTGNKICCCGKPLCSFSVSVKTSILLALCISI